MEDINIKLAKDRSLAIVKGVSLANVSERRQKINELEIAMLQQPQVEINVKHHFNGGMYGREILIPKDTLLVSRIHKFDHFDIMISGDIAVSTDTGETKRLTGFHIFKGKAGKKE